jgi:hypothetical protein
MYVKEMAYIINSLWTLNRNILHNLEVFYVSEIYTHQAHKIGNVIDNKLM